MREFTLTQNLLDLALQKADTKQILRVNLLIGPFSEEREELIRFSWKDLAKGSPGEGAELHFEQSPVEIKCLNCTGMFHLDEEESLCKFCYREEQQLLHGEDVKLKSIEVQ
jgi:hydrogenase nickel incorporation protein HypA/HybF